MPLYVVGTPIGNLEDLSPRARRILGEVDLIAAEDTRTTRKLLSHFDIHKPVIAFFQHSTPKRKRELMDRLESGSSIAMVSEAGTPGISDPGASLVDDAFESGIPVFGIPGPSAVATAASICGFPVDRFIFEGFPPRKAGKRKKLIESWLSESRTILFYESPHRIISTMEICAEVLGDRRIVLARELTKVYEEVVRTTPREAVERFAKKPPKGEFTVIVEGSKP
jgi:16S rRNA (cytidine1402-2'-O)-methyltransferase